MTYVSRTFNIDFPIFFFFSVLKGFVLRLFLGPVRVLLQHCTEVFGLVQRLFKLQLKRPEDITFQRCYSWFMYVGEADKKSLYIGDWGHRLHEITRWKRVVFVVVKDSSTFASNEMYPLCGKRYQKFLNRGEHPVPLLWIIGLFDRLALNCCFLCKHFQKLINAPVIRDVAQWLAKASIFG